MNEPCLVGINEASRLTGKNKAIISRDSKSGRLSFIVDEGGVAKRYYVSELERVYGKLRNPVTGYEPVTNHQNEPLEETIVTSALPEVIKAKNEVIDLLKRQVEDLQRERDNWREQAIRVLPPPPEPSRVQPATKERFSFWPFRKENN